jgi:hypothetical protein
MNSFAELGTVEPCSSSYAQAEAVYGGTSHPAEAAKGGEIIDNAISVAQRIILSANVKIVIPVVPATESIVEARKLRLDYAPASPKNRYGGLKHDIRLVAAYFGYVVTENIGRIFINMNQKVVFVVVEGCQQPFELI